MKNRFHGILSITLFFLALVIAAFNIFFYSIFFGIIYIILIPVLFLSVIYFYCRKCPHIKNESCKHALFGPLAKKFKNIKSGQYNLIDYLGTVIPMLIVVIYPQFWLYKNKIYFTIFIILSVIAVVQINFLVCPECRNINCPNCKKKF